MRKVSSTTYFLAALVDGDMLSTITAAKAAAAERLGGEDGLTCVSASVADAGHVAMTWRREWEEDEPQTQVSPQNASGGDAATAPQTDPARSVPMRGRIDARTRRRLGIADPE